MRNSRDMLVSPTNVLYTNLRSLIGMFENSLCRLIRSRSDFTLLSTLKIDDSLMRYRAYVGTFLRGTNRAVSSSILLFYS